MHLKLINLRKRFIDHSLVDFELAVFIGVDWVWSGVVQVWWLFIILLGCGFSFKP
jgi:hypothetical protein